MQYTRPKKRYGTLQIILVVLTALAVLAVVALSISSMVIKSNQNSIQRYCGVATGEEMGTPSGGKAISMINTKWNERIIGWEIQYQNFTGVPIGVHIHGPAPYGLDTGPLFVALCGTPSTLACDTSIAGYLSGEIEETAGGGALRPVIQAIRKEPCRYDARIKTSAYPDGEVRLRLCSLCGTPI